MNFCYYESNNIFSLKITKYFLLFLFILNKKNFNTLFFSNLDATIIQNSENNYYYLSIQTVFCDFKILIITNFIKNIQSLSNVYFGNS